jgi:aminoglycoside phosphotransferase (APT) family kinase protein
MTDDGVDIDTSGLESYLSAELAETVVDISLLHEALNYSLAVSTADCRRAYVLRTPNMLRETDSFIDLRREYEVLERLQDTAVAAPEPVLFRADDSPIGNPFLLMTHLDGESIPLGTRPPERFQHPEARQRLAIDLIDTLADIHTVDTGRFTDLCDRTTPYEQVVTDIERLDDATEVTGHDPPGLQEVGEWLRDNAPSDPVVTLSHGDFRPGNVLFTGAERPAISGVVDWETAFLGDPRVELGYLLLRWRDDGDPTPDVDEIAARCSDAEAIADLRETTEYGLAPFTSAPGTPSRRELIDRYEERTGISVENERFYLALGAFMLAAVWADIHRHALEAGESSSKKPYVEYMSMLAGSIVRGEFGH